MLRLGLVIIIRCIEIKMTTLQSEEYKGYTIKFSVNKTNPLTGEYTYPKMRKPEIGYASYIGITGDNETVMNIVKDIKANAYIKGESPYEREFI